MEAPWKDQLALLDLQELDTKITKLVSRRKKLPQLARLTELTESNKQLAAKLTELSTLKTDKKRAITALENEVAGIETRRKTQQNRLDNGQGSPKELLRLQTEIQQMNKRVEDLEGQLLAVMSEVEHLDAVDQKISQRQAEYAQETITLKEEVEGENSQIGEELKELENQRNQRIAGIDSDLLDLYENIKLQTGGVGAIKVVAGRPVGYNLSFSVAETARLRAAKPEEVITSEDEGYLLIRCPQ